MDQTLQGRRIAFLTANEGVEEIELTEPWKAVKEAGGEPVLLAPSAKVVQSFNHLDKGVRYEPDGVIGLADARDFDALVLPGGVANPDQLRTDPDAICFVKRIVDAGKPVAAICHAPWTLVEADVVRGRRLTSWPSLQTDIRNAGGDWVDEEVVVDGGLVSSRRPDDLAAFCTAMISEFASATPRPHEPVS